MDLRTARWRSLAPPEGTPRMLAPQTFSTSVGSGVFAAGSAVFFTSYVGLSVNQVALGLSIAGAVAFLSQVPVGMLVDRVGSRRAWILSTMLAAPAYAAYPIARGVVAYIAIVSIIAAISVFGALGRGRYIADVMPPDSRVRVSAYMRAVQNGGYSVGLLLSGIALAIGAHWALLALPIGNAMSYLADAVMIARYCPSPATRAGRRPASGSRFVALRDRPFMMLALVNCVVMSSDVILTIVLPLWIIARTSAPHYVIALIFVVNTTMCVAFQARAGRNADGLAKAARVQRRAGLLIAIACAIFAATASAHGAWTVWLLAAGTVVLTFAEIMEAVAAWGISYELAPEARRGEYLGAYGLGPQLMRMIGPSAIAAVVINGRAAGWLALGLVVVVAGSLAVPFASWAIRVRTAAQAAVDSGLAGVS